MSLHCRHAVYTVATLSTRRRYTSATLSLHSRYAFATLSLPCRFTVTTISLRCLYNVATISLHNGYTVATMSLYCGNTVATISLRCFYDVATLSLHRGHDPDVYLHHSSAVATGSQFRTNINIRTAKGTLKHTEMLIMRIHSLPEGNFGPRAMCMWKKTIRIQPKHVTVRIISSGIPLCCRKTSRLKYSYTGGVKTEGSGESEGV